MYEYNYFYGSIIIDRDFKNSQNFISEIMPDKNYFYFHPSIFSSNTQEYSYENMMISFARTVKYLFYEIDELYQFIKEFEDILKNLDFENAQIKIGGIYCDYTLFWNNKKKLFTNGSTHSIETTKECFKEYNVRFFENNDFYFGFGEINLSTGWVNEEYNKENLESFDIQFPDFNYNK